VFNARETADNLKKSGAFIPVSGRSADRRVHRPGAHAPDAVGATYIMAVCLLPEVLVSSQGVPFQFAAPRS